MENNINKELKNKAEEYAVEAPIESWAFIEAALHKKKDRKPVWIFILCTAIALITTSIYLIVNNKTENITVKNNLEQKEIANAKLKDLIIEKTKEENATAEIETINYKTNESEIKNNTSKLIKIKKIADENEEAIAENTKRKINLKSKQQIKISSPIAEVENNENVIESKKEDIKSNLNNEESNLVNINSETTGLPIKSTDTIKSEIEITKLKNTDTFTTAKTFFPKGKPRKKAKYLLGLNIEQLYINKGSLSNLFSSNETMNYTFATSPLSTINNSNGYDVDFNNGKSIGISLSKEYRFTKKINFQLGVNIAFNNFSSYAYKAIPLNIITLNDALSIGTNSTNINSNYSSYLNVLGGAGVRTNSSIKIKSRYQQVGFTTGINYNLFKLKKNNTLQIETLLNPTIVFGENIYWHNTANQRYFIDKKIMSNFSLSQDIALLLSNKNYKVGLVYGFNYTNLNRKIQNLQNMKTSSFGLQFQYAIK